MEVSVAGVAPAARLQPVAIADRHRLLDRLAAGGRAGRRCPRSPFPRAEPRPRSRLRRASATAPPPRAARPAPRTATASSASASASSPCRRSASALAPSASAITMNPAPRGRRRETTPPAAASAPASRYSSAAAVSPAADHPLDRRAARLGARRRMRPPAAPPRAPGIELQPRGGDHAERPLRADQQALQVVAGHVLADRARRPRRPRRAERPPPARSPRRRSTPYLNACGPPALVATLPPICDCSAAPGSGGNRSPFSRASRRTSPVRSPASTQIRHRSGSKERTPRHPLEAEDDPALGHRAGRESGAAAPRHDRHLVLVAPADHGGHLVRARRQRQGVGAAPDAAMLGRVGQICRRRRSHGPRLGAALPAPPGSRPSDA